MATTDPQGQSFPAMQNDCILRVARGEKTEYTPIWMMRQAGRHLPEYRKLREGRKMTDCFRDPQIVSEISIQPTKRYDIDACIIFCDILVVCEALGLDVTYDDGIKFEKLLTLDRPLEEQLDRDGALERMQYIFEAITLTRHKLNGKVPLIGFAGGPFTLMGYMVGATEKKDPDLLKRLYYSGVDLNNAMDLVAEVVTKYLIEQVKAGVQMVQLFESFGHVCNSQMLEDLVYPKIKKVFVDFKKQTKELGYDVPTAVFIRGTSDSVKLLDEPDNGIDVITIDWHSDPREIRKRTTKVVQGNFDPDILKCNPESIAPVCERMLKEFGVARYIANLGHGVPPSAKIECVDSLVKTVHAFSKSMMNSK